MRSALFDYHLSHCFRKGTKEPTTLSMRLRIVLFGAGKFDALLLELSLDRTTHGWNETLRDPRELAVLDPANAMIAWRTRRNRPRLRHQGDFHGHLAAMRCWLRSLAASSNIWPAQR